MTLHFLKVKNNRGIYYSHEYRSVGLNLSGALALFAPTYDELEDLKQSCIENVREVIKETRREYPSSPVLAWIMKEVDDCIIKNKTEGYLRTIKRIVSRQKHLQNPTRPESRITDDQIQRAREVPIEELIDGRVFKAGNKVTAHCPFHQERTPSFFIFPDNRYKCFGCGEYGDSIAFVMKRDGMKFVDAVISLSK